MSNKSHITPDQLEARLSRWKQWFYLCLGAAVIMLLQGFIKFYENTHFHNVIFYLEEKANISDFFFTYSQEVALAIFSPWRALLWLVVESVILASAAILGMASPWRKITFAKRLNLIGGFLLAGWLNLLALGAIDPLNIGNDYNVLVLVYMFLLGGGYWALRRKYERAEEIFP